MANAEWASPGQPAEGLSGQRLLRLPRLTSPWAKLSLGSPLPMAEAAHWLRCVTCCMCETNFASAACSSLNPPRGSRRWRRATATARSTCNPETCEKMAGAAGLGLLHRVCAGAAHQSLGNLTAWRTQTRSGFTILSFVDCAKYPLMRAPREAGRRPALARRV